MENVQQTVKTLFYSGNTIFFRQSRSCEVEFWLEQNICTHLKYCCLQVPCPLQLLKFWTVSATILFLWWRRLVKCFRYTLILLYWNVTQFEKSFDFFYKATKQSKSKNLFRGGLNLFLHFAVVLSFNLLFFLILAYEM